MTEPVQTALIAAGAALVGGALGVAGSVFVERARATIARRERERERCFAAVEAFQATLTEWVVYMGSLPERGVPEHAETFATTRLKAEEVRRAIRSLELLAPDEIVEWLHETCNPLQLSLFTTVIEFLSGEASDDEVEAAATALSTARREALPMFRAFLDVSAP